MLSLHAVVVHATTNESVAASATERLQTVQDIISKNHGISSSVREFVYHIHKIDPRLLDLDLSSAYHEDPICCDLADIYSNQRLRFILDSVAPTLRRLTITAGHLENSHLYRGGIDSFLPKSGSLVWELLTHSANRMKHLQNLCIDVHGSIQINSLKTILSSLTSLKELDISHGGADLEHGSLDIVLPVLTRLKLRSLKSSHLLLLIAQCCPKLEVLKVHVVHSAREIAKEQVESEQGIKTSINLQKIIEYLTPVQSTLKQLELDFEGLELDEYGPLPTEGKLLNFVMLEKFKLHNWLLSKDVTPEALYDSLFSSEVKEIQWTNSETKDRPRFNHKQIQIIRNALVLADEKNSGLKVFEIVGNLGCDMGRKEIDDYLERRGIWEVFQWWKLQVYEQLQARKRELDAASLDVEDQSEDEDPGRENLAWLNQMSIPEVTPPVPAFTWLADVWTFIDAEIRCVELEVLFSIFEDPLENIKVVKTFEFFDFAYPVSYKIGLKGVPYMKKSYKKVSYGDCLQ